MKSFLSYPSEQLLVARAIYDFLISVGVQPWFDKECLVGGQDWDRERKAALRSAELTFLILSSETISRPGVIQREVKEILELLQDKPLGHIFLVTLRTKELPVPAELSTYQYIDYARPGWQVKLGQSVNLRFEQLGVPAPAALKAFLYAQERENRVVFKALRSRTAGIEALADYFIYQQAGEYWEFVNAEITADILGGFLRVGMKKPFGQALRSIYWERQVEEHFRQGELVSLRVSASEFHGGPYPNHGVYTKNFGGGDVGKVEIGDLFGRDRRAQEFLYSYCNRDIERQWGRTDGLARYTLRHEFEWQDPWSLLAQWNFSSDGIQIWLSEWSGVPHAVGIMDVIIPWAQLKDLLCRDFKETSIGRFVLSQ